MLLTVDVQPAFRDAMSGAGFDFPGFARYARQFRVACVYSDRDEGPMHAGDSLVDVQDFWAHLDVPVSVWVPKSYGYFTYWLREGRKPRDYHLAVPELIELLRWMQTRGAMRADELDIEAVREWLDAEGILPDELLSSRGWANAPILPVSLLEQLQALDGPFVLAGGSTHRCLLEVQVVLELASLPFVVSPFTWCDGLPLDGPGSVGARPSDDGGARPMDLRPYLLPDAAPLPESARPRHDPHPRDEFRETDGVRWLVPTRNDDVPIEVPAQYLVPMALNIFDPVQLTGFYRAIREARQGVGPKPVLPMPPATVWPISVTEVAESQQAARAGRIHELGLEEPFTTGDPQLDAFWADPEEFVDEHWEDWWEGWGGDDDVADASPVDQADARNRLRAAMDEALAGAVRAGAGDFGNLVTYLRGDGHHRSFAALLAGEPTIWVSASRHGSSPDVVGATATAGGRRPEALPTRATVGAASVPDPSARGARGSRRPEVYETVADLERLLPRLGELHAWHGTLRAHRPSIEEIGVIGRLGRFVQDFHDEHFLALMETHGAHDAEELEQMLDAEGMIAAFFARRASLQSSANAIHYHVTTFLSRVGDPTPDEIARHGMLAAYTSAHGFYVSDVNQNIWELRSVWEDAHDLLDHAPEEILGNEATENAWLTARGDAEGYYLRMPPHHVVPPVGVEPGDLFVERAGLPDAIIIGEALVGLLATLDAD